MEQLPLYIPVVFGLTVLATVWLFAKASRYNRAFLVTITVWIIFQSLLGLAGFYSIANPTPPRFPVLVLPPILAIVALFGTQKGRAFVNSLNLKDLTILHTVRIPVEIVLFWLYAYQAVPELMTFEGRNFDIFSGLSAPVVYYFAFVRKRLGKNVLLLWNSICLALVLNIVFYATLSAPTPFQQFAFSQPNIAIGHFPFNLLPSCVVPLVLLAHLAAIRQLLSKKTVPTNLHI